MKVKFVESEEYQGYANRETWAVCVWLANDYGFYTDTRNMGARRLERYFDELWKMKGENRALQSMFDDIGSIARVNWEEVENDVAEG